MLTRQLLPLLVTSLLWVAAPASAGEKAGARPDLTGHWVLNEKASDLPGPGGFGGRGGMRDGGMGESTGGAGMREGMGGPPGGAEPGTMRGGMGGGRMSLPADMVVELAPTDLTVLVRGLAVRRLRFGPADSATAVTDSLPTLAARWQAARLVSEFPSRRGGTVRETWELSKDAKRLTVRTELPAMGDRPGREFKRVYERSETP